MWKYPWLEDLDGILYCPTCLKQIDNIWQDSHGDLENMDLLSPEFCPFCGQHLDWAKTIMYGVLEEHEEESGMDEKNQILCLETQINTNERTIEAQRQEIAALRGKVEAYEKALDVFGKALDCLKACGEN